MSSIRERMKKIQEEAMAKTKAKADKLRDKFSQPVTPVQPIQASVPVEEIGSESIEDVMDDIMSDLIDIEESNVNTGMVNCMPVAYTGVLKLNATAPKAQTPSEVSVTRNQAKNGIEIRFSKKPSEVTLSLVKNEGFFYSRKQNMWYAKYTEGKMKFAEQIRDVINGTTV